MPAWTVAIGKARASGHNLVSVKFSYSTLRIGLPSFTKIERAEHSSYCQQDSLISPSTSGASVSSRLSPLTSFFKK
jgi:hypothetical protein